MPITLLFPPPQILGLYNASVISYRLLNLERSNIYLFMVL